MLNLKVMPDFGYGNGNNVIENNPSIRGWRLVSDFIKSHDKYERLSNFVEERVY